MKCVEGVEMCRNGHQLVRLSRQGLKDGIWLKWVEDYLVCIVGYLDMNLWFIETMSDSGEYSGSIGWSDCEDPNESVLRTNWGDGSVYTILWEIGGEKWWTLISHNWFLRISSFLLILQHEEDWRTKSIQSSCGTNHHVLNTLTSS